MQLQKFNTSRVSSARAPVVGRTSAVVMRAAQSDLSAQIASLEKQIRDANSEARKAPLIAQLNALKGGSSSFSAPAPAAVPAASWAAAAAAEPKASFKPSAAATVVPDKEVAAKIASLEKQIRDANSDARKAPLIAQLNALRGGSSAVSSYSAPAPAPVAPPRPISPPPSPVR